MTGLFIVFEGPEGAGKSTQARLLGERLEGQGYGVTVTREPGGTPVGEQLRSLLLDHGSYTLLAETEALLYAAARAEHVRTVIDPALKAGRVVVCDRFVDSALAYQGGGRGLAIDDLLHVQRFAAGGVTPDLRFLLDLPVEIGISRRRSAPEELNRLDAEDLDFHRRVRMTYLELMRQDPAGWCRIDATRNTDDVAAEVATAVTGLLETVPGSTAAGLSR